MAQFYLQTNLPPQISPGPTDKNKNSKICIIKILLDNSASASILCREVLYKRHRILKDNKNKWSTMTGSFQTTFVTDIILKLPELNH